ncbi:MAG: S41 family peptidase [Lachnospiraceae bacterium]|nr:S41 family peptidase [Lachnospiraceae bacterium]
MEELNIQENCLKENEQVKEKEKKGGFWKGFFCATILFTIIAALCLGVGLYVKVKSVSNADIGLVTQSEKVQSKLGLLEMYIRSYYLEEIDDDQMEDYLYYGLVAGLGDPYAAYYNEEETQSMLDSSSGNYCGIGAVFSQNLVTGVITVSRVYEGFPSYEAGIQPEDILYKVEGEEVTGMDLTNVVAKIKGEEGTEVTVSMLRGEEVLDFTMKRQEIKVPTVEHEMLEDQIGYILITEFDGVTSEQFHEALTDLQAQGMEKLIIDLRNNGGGSVDAVCEIADELLPEGLIVYTEYSDGERVDRNSDADCIDIPMAVLVNGASASASEILSGALKDYGVAKIVGTQTYGKGIVQSVLDLQDGTALKLTTAKYYTPNGNNIHGVGITPDVEIDLPEELKTEVTLSYEEDVQLQKAIEVLQQ